MPKVNQLQMYPPIVDTSMPLFDGNNVDVFFDLSYMQKYTDSDPDNAQYYSLMPAPGDLGPFGRYDSTSIYSMQVSLNNQNSNSSEWYAEHATFGIAYRNIAYRAVQGDESREKWNYNLFHININKDSLIGGEEQNNTYTSQWKDNIYYKCQMRLLKDPFKYITGQESANSNGSVKHEAAYYKTESNPVTGAIKFNQFFTPADSDGQEFINLINTYLWNIWLERIDGLFNSYKGAKGVLRYLIPKSRQVLKWIEDNGYVSEWSTICLLRHIPTPQGSLFGQYELKINSSDAQTQISQPIKTPLPSFPGQVIFADSDLEPETLEKVTFILRPILQIAGEDETGDSDIKLSQKLDNYNYYNTFEFKLNQQLPQPDNDKTIKCKLYLSFESRNGWIGRVGTYTKNENDLYIMDHCVELDVDIQASLENIFTLSYKPNNYKGYTELSLVVDTRIEQNNSVTVFDGGKYMLLRTSSKSHFKVYDELFVLDVPAQEAATVITYKFIDSTCESGTWYEYCLQRADEAYTKNGYVGTGTLYDPAKQDYINYKNNPSSYQWNDGSQYGQSVMKYPSGSAAPAIQQPILPEFQELYLTNSDGHYYISFNEQITSYRHNMQESVVETLGSQYPFTFRNGRVNYRTVQINGTISYSDNDEIIIRACSSVPTDNPDFANNNLFTEEVQGFMNKKSIWAYDPYIKDPEEEENANALGYVDTLYNQYYMTYNIPDSRNTTLEREFRKHVISFLQSGRVFLLKTAAEGNLLVRLTEFSYSPKVELDNLVYDFSCTATEVASTSIDNLQKYDIPYFQASKIQNGVEDPAKNFCIRCKDSNFYN